MEEWLGHPIYGTPCSKQRSEFRVIGCTESCKKQIALCGVQVAYVLIISVVVASVQKACGRVIAY